MKISKKLVYGLKQTGIFILLLKDFALTPLKHAIKRLIRDVIIG